MAIDYDALKKQQETEAGVNMEEESNTFEYQTAAGASTALKDHDTNWLGVPFNSKHVFTANEITELVHKLNEKILMYYDGGLSVGKISKSSHFNQNKLIPTSRGDFINEHENRSIRVAVSADKNKRVPLSKIWLQHPERKTIGKDAIFLPGHAPMSMVGDKFNTFAGLTAIPKMGTKHLRALKFIRDHIAAGDRGLYQHILNYMAVRIQDPEYKINAALAFVSKEEGTGKGIFVEHIFGRLMGRHLVRYDKLSKLMNDFNSRISEAYMIYIDEAELKFDPAAVDFLKTLITSERISITKKYQEATDDERVYFNVCVCMNHEEGGLKLDRSDRRWTVAKVVKNGWIQEDYRKFAEIYLKDQEVFDNLLWFLQTYKADKPMANRVYNTDIKTVQVDNSLSLCDQFFEFYLAEIIKGDYKVKFSEFRDDTKRYKDIKAGAVVNLLEAYVRQRGGNVKHDVPGVRIIGRLLKKWWKDNHEYVKRCEERSRVIAYDASVLEFKDHIVNPVLEDNGEF